MKADNFGSRAMAASIVDTTITWSPSINGRNFDLDVGFQRWELFPPFLQKFRKSSGEQRRAGIRSKVHIDSVEDEPRNASISSEDTANVEISTCRNPGGDFPDAENLNLPGEIAEKCRISCGNACRAGDLTSEEIRDESEDETKSFAEIADAELRDVFELHDEDYQQLPEDSDRDEADRAERKEKTDLLRLLDQCDSFSSVSDVADDPPDTTDPYLSHDLSVPYNRVPRSRYFHSASQNVDYVAATLPRRPRSPVRELLPGRFDLRAAFEEWDRKQRISETRKYLEESKRRISDSLKRLSADRNDRDWLISSVVLQAVCEQVTMTLMGTKIDTDIHTFVNIAVVWALSELDLFSIETLPDNFALPKNLGFLDSRQSELAGSLGPGGMRRTLLGVYRAPFSRNLYTTLHRRLPWPYIGPSHERGHTKLYPNVRERIDEKVPKVDDDDPASTYVPDLTCFHLREVLDKSYVAYRRKSKSLALPTVSSVKMIEDLFVQLVSFM